MIPDCTLTTACYNFTNVHKFSRTFDECINNMKGLLEIPCYLCIFTDHYCIDEIKKIRQSFNLDELTHYIIIDFKDTPKYQYVELVRENRKKYHPTRDDRTCPESHILTVSKFDFVLHTMDINPFNTTKFGWIDSNLGGIRCSKICENYENNMLLNILKNTNPLKFSIQILNVCDKKYKKEENKKEYYEQYRWLVCGCLFITGIEVGKPILNRLNEIAINTMIQGYGHAEEMCYLEVLDEYYDDIEKSYGDYFNILNNFIRPTKGFLYILMIIRNYLNFRYYRECIDCCKKVLHEFENYNIAMDYNIYFLILFNYYVALAYYNKEEAINIANKIMNLVSINPYIRTEFNKNSNFYKDQLRYMITIP